MKRYQGTPDAPFPPSPAHFRLVAAGDGYARQRASGLLGSLPPYHFVDERGPAALYRFFSYETPGGVSVSALCRPLEGEPAMFGLGAPPAPTTTSEPIPAGRGWIADASTPQVTAIAQNIGFHNSPVGWRDQGIYNTTVNGSPYRFVMWWENGLKAVAAYKAAPVFGLGATLASFVAPTAAQVAANPPGQALADAANAVLIEFAASGVPSEHVNDAKVLAFQTAWNANPIGQLNGGNSQLSVDGSYGANTHDALASLTAGAGAPAVNAAAAGTTPVPTPAAPALIPVPAPTPAATTTTAQASSTSAAPAIILGTLVVGSLVAVGFAAKKPLKAMRHAHYTHHHR